jgi:hypothetical protein
LYLQFKKQKGDPAMPKAIDDLRQRCIEIDGRRSPVCTPCQDFDDDDSSQSENELDKDQSATNENINMQSCAESDNEEFLDLCLLDRSLSSTNKTNASCVSDTITEI